MHWQLITGHYGHFDSYPNTVQYSYSVVMISVTVISSTVISITVISVTVISGTVISGTVNSLQLIQI